MTQTIGKGFRMTGHKALAIFVGAFGLIISVNLFMAYSAVRTFPGLEVQNSYVASQGFNEALARQLALGWEVRVEHAEGKLKVHFTDAEGAPVDVADMTATLGRATHTRDDTTPAFAYERGTFSAPVALEPGNWNLRLVAHAPDGTEFRQRISFWHRG
ncbi:MAG: FixH family protein [Pararhodobacter sp.]